MKDKLKFYASAELGGQVTKQDGTPLLKIDDLIVGGLYYVPALMGKISMKVTSINGKSAQAENNPKLAAFLDFDDKRGWTSSTSFNPKLLGKLKL